MGGAIAQLLAIKHPDRVRSLTLFYTVPAFSPEDLTDVIRQRLADAPPPVPADRGAAIEAHVKNERISASNTDSFDEAWIREIAGLAYDRGYRPDGVQRQTAAILGSGDRSPKLPNSRFPPRSFAARRIARIKP